MSPASPVGKEAGSMSSLLENSDLSVDNYAFLTQVGQDVFARQLNILENSGMEKDEDGGSESPLSAEATPMSPGSPGSPQSPFSPGGRRSEERNRNLKPGQTWTAGQGR